ncbi:MAG TPA: xanthine dehydrogenase family protein molybdopterin-binding subunit [Stellaceae bacterium]
MTHSFAGRREDGRLVTGTGRFTADWNLPGQLHAAFRRSEHAHADIAGVNAEAALALPGVVAVLTGEDAVAAGFDRSHVVMPVKGRGGEAVKAPPRPALAHGRARYAGDPVALVVAETEAAAQDAAELLEIDYRILPAVADAAAALAPGAPQVHDGIPGNLCFDYEYGDAAATDAAFAAAAHVVSLTLESARVVGNPMEPKAALAAWNGEFLDLWTATQGMVAFRDSLAAQTGLPPDRIRIRAQDVGGAFGIRGPAYPEHAALALAARRVGRPVKWVASRSETFLSDYHGRGLVMTGELALDAEGRFLAIRHAWLCDQGAYPVATGPLINTLNPAMMCVGCYRIPAVYGRHKLAVTNTVPITAYRGAGRPDMAYMVERLVDEAARRTGVDRLELRRRNLIPREAFPYRLPTGPGASEYDSGDYAALLQAATEAADWAGFEARRAEVAARGRLRGIGCSLFVEPSGGVAPRDEVAIAFTQAGASGDGGAEVVIHSVIGPSGQGHETVMPEIVARCFGIAPERIVLRTGDPDGPALFGGGAFASRSMLSHGAAALVTAREVVRKGRALAADALEAAEEDIEFTAGLYRIKGTDRAIGLLKLAERHAGTVPHPLDTRGELPASRAFPSGAHVAEVEIDPETGVTELLRYVAVDDCGVVLNPTLLEGQILGGMMQGLGQVFGEVGHYDQGSGQLLSGSFMDYVMPRADLLRDVVVRNLCVPSPNNPLGVKGAGEAGTTGALPAAMNAVLDALRPAGVRHLDMPASPLRVWAAIRDAGEGTD